MRNDVRINGSYKGINSHILTSDEIKEVISLYRSGYNGMEIAKEMKQKRWWLMYQVIISAKRRGILKDKNKPAIITTALLPKPIIATAKNGSTIIPKMSMKESGSTKRIVIEQEPDEVYTMTVTKSKIIISIEKR